MTRTRTNLLGAQLCNRPTSCYAFDKLIDSTDARLNYVVLLSLTTVYAKRMWKNNEVGLVMMLILRVMKMIIMRIMIIIER